jgi:hypothetical protein
MVTMGDVFAVGQSDWLAPARRTPRAGGHRWCRYLAQGFVSHSGAGPGVGPIPSAVKASAILIGGSIPKVQASVAARLETEERQRSARLMRVAMEDGTQGYRVWPQAGRQAVRKEARSAR